MFRLKSSVEMPVLYGDEGDQSNFPTNRADMLPTET